MVNCKLKIKKTVFLLMLFVLLGVVGTIAAPAQAAVTNCGLSQNNPDTPEDDTRPCTGLVPCTGVTCSFCDLFKLAGNIFDFVIKTITPIVATGFIMYGGFKYITAAGREEAVKSARKILFNTLIGVVIVYASFVLASGLVAALAGQTGGTNFGFTGTSFTFVCSSTGPQDVTGGFATGGGLVLALKDLAEPILKEGVVMSSAREEESPETIETTTRAEFVSGDNVVVRKGVNMSGVNSAALTGFQQAGLSLANEGIVLAVDSAKRDITKQRQIIADFVVAGACPINPTRSSDCNPKVCIPTDDTASNCPHVNGRALDVWGIQDGKQCGNRSTITECQRKVIQAMKAQGFCVLSDEHWHFEKPAAAGGKVSGNCRY